MASSNPKPILGNGWYVEISSSKIPQFSNMTFTLRDSQNGSELIEIYKEDEYFDSFGLENDNSFTYRFGEYGYYTIFNGNGSVTQWSVEEPSFNFMNVETLFVNGDEIRRLEDSLGQILFDNAQFELFFTIRGDTVSTRGIRLGNSCIVDFGDGTREELNGVSSFYHEYEDEIEEHEIKVSDMNLIINFAQGCFLNSATLTSINIPASVKNIPYGCCTNCSILHSATINSLNLTKNCFDSCSQLMTVNFLSNVSSIGEYSFANCTNLTDIVFESSEPPLMSDNCFLNTPESCVMQVPKGSIEDYIVALEGTGYNGLVINKKNGGELG